MMTLTKRSLRNCTSLSALVSSGIWYQLDFAHHLLHKHIYNSLHRQQESARAINIEWL